MIGQDTLEEQRAKAKGDIPSNAQYFFSDEEKKKFRDDPAFHLQYRKKLESAVNNLFEMFLKETETNREAERLMKAEMHRRLGPGHEELKEKLIPRWPPGCRRITPGDGYLEALVQPSKSRSPLFYVAKKHRCYHYPQGNCQNCSRRSRRRGWQPSPSRHFGLCDGFQLGLCASVVSVLSINEGKY